MRKLFPTLLLVMALAVSAIAGDISSPACVDPPPDGDGVSATASITITDVLLSLISWP